MKWMLVICDYNYLFDPRVSLKRLIEDQKESTALLIDEAHNLVDRGREMFSATLTKATFLQLKKDYKGTGKSIYELSNKVNAWFIELKKLKAEKNEFILEELDSELKLLLFQFMEAAGTRIEDRNIPKSVRSVFRSEKLFENY